MNKLSIFILKALRKVYAKSFGGYQLPALDREENPDKVSDMIYELLESGKPCMIARYGSTELSAIVNYLGIKEGDKNICKYIKGESLDWWWNDSVLQQMQRWSGFFPPTPEKISQFCELMLEDSKQVDILGSWIASEYLMEVRIQKKFSKIHLEWMNPFFVDNPWTRVLKGKRVLVIHPLKESIENQFKRKDLIFPNGFLPDFQLEVIEAVQSLGGVSSYNDWFDALEYMKSEIDKRDYDICLLGCGAYGFPLAAYIKRQGKQAIHLGGVLQLYFGIIGSRWESVGYIDKEYNYSKFFNEYWVRPSAKEIPTSAKQVENGCYW